MLKDCWVNMVLKSHNYMEFRIEHIEQKQLIGMSLMMNFAEFRVEALWKQFAPRVPEIIGRKTTDRISLTVYPDSFFKDFNIANNFEKWAAVEVSNLDCLPQGMKSFVIPSGMHAVFNYRGLSTDHSVYNYIYEVWLPNSAYVLDNRPHFEVLGDSYKNNDESSQEEIWIPIKEVK
jgi:AraC family transcriptional regulator